LLRHTRDEPPTTTRRSPAIRQRPIDFPPIAAAYIFSVSFSRASITLIITILPFPFSPLCRADIFPLSLQRRRVRSTRPPSLIGVWKRPRPVRPSVITLPCLDRAPITFKQHFALVSSRAFLDPTDCKSSTLNNSSIASIIPRQQYYLLLPIRTLAPSDRRVADAGLVSKNSSSTKPTQHRHRHFSRIGDPLDPSHSGVARFHVSFWTLATAFIDLGRHVIRTRHCDHFADRVFNAKRTAIGKRVG
jgi:hypothetical protein